MGGIGRERIGGPLSWRNSQASLLAATPPPAGAAPRCRRARVPGREKAASLSDDTIRLVTIGG
ncbi:hypothetical protein GCM10023238_06280 [Streptomyces heliomycini]